MGKGVGGWGGNGGTGVGREKRGDRDGGGKGGGAVKEKQGCMCNYCVFRVHAFTAAYAKAWNPVDCLPPV